MEIIQVNLRDRKQVRAFLDLPFRLYQEDQHWVPPLAGDERLRLDPKKYPFYRHSSAAFFLAGNIDQPVGRLAVMDNRRYNDFNNEKAAFFTLFECEPDLQAALGLFEAAFDWARARGLVRMIGPRGFTPLDGLGMLVRGFDRRPALGQPYNPAYYPQFIEEAGFRNAGEIVSGYLSPDLPFPPRIHDLARLVREKRGLQVARFNNRRELRRMLGNLESLYNGSLGSSGGTPLTPQEVRAMARQMLWFADPHLIKIILKGEKPVGFLLAYPDISAALQSTRGRLFPFGWIRLLRELRRTDWININGAGLIEEVRGLGGTAILYSEMFKSVTENPRYRHAEVVQIGLENDKMLREMQNFGVDFYKMHRLYEREL